MNKTGRRLVIAAVVVVIIIVLSIINLFVYPFKSSQPNFSDVERVFNKIEIPADWVEISSSENSGIAGRACPIESSGCFSIGKRFNVPATATIEDIGVVYESSGCSPVSIKEDSQTEGDPPVRYQCSVEGMTISGDYYRDIKEVSVYVFSD